MRPTAAGRDDCRAAASGHTQPSLNEIFDILPQTFLQPAHRPIVWAGQTYDDAEVAHVLLEVHPKCDVSFDMQPPSIKMRAREGQTFSLK